MNYFKKWNLIAGWLAFAIAAVVYILTLEPTTSLWDCPEFIATSYKLQVGHPPGAPLFMMIARFFTMFAPSADSVAFTVNLMSGLCGAFTVLFLFWSITHLARKIYAKTREELTQSQTWTVIGAGLIGSLAYCFTDTQWFSAVEAEVYSMSSMFTALVVWAMLQWESVADEPHSNRWLILIAYIMGLSIGVHILNLLAIPALVFIYYFRKYPQVRFWGVVKATLTAGALLVVMNYIVIPYTVAIGAWVDRIFVNGLGLPVNSGLLFFVMLLFALCAFGIYITHKKGKVLANIMVLCLTFILIGYSSYASVVIRAVADPPMNSNDPSNPYALLSLLSRDQYGDRPLLHGPFYTSVEKIMDYKTRNLVTLGEDGRYYDTEVMAGYVFHPDVLYFFPRVYSFDQRHIEGYKAWGNIMGRPQYVEGHRIEGVPTAAENLRFFFNYQVNHMYWRYFLWNFAGRQNDIQGHGGLIHGNWLSGIKAIDQIHLGPQDNLPSEMADNKARNTYYFLPFLLGLIGLVYQLGRDKKNFTVVMWLFVMMGLALVVYFNATPGEPRERDYIYAGSFYAFCIWIGFGVLAVRDWIVKLSKKDNIAIAVGATVICSCVPVILAAQNWDDHDRSHRYVARDMGYNYLESCLPNSIIMNYGDNDTFPLWYNQEVENVRPDVRIMNTSYLGGEWYINQMKRKYNESEPVPFSLPRNKYANVNEVLAVRDMVSEPVSLRELMNFIKRDDKASKEQTVTGWSDFIPTKSVYMTVNKANAIASGIVAEKDAHFMVDTIVLRFTQDRIDRTELMMLDLLDNFDWKRPLFFTQPFLAKFGLTEYLQFDGFAFRLVPIRTADSAGGFYNTGRIDVEYIYPRLMEMFRYGNVSDPRVYADEYTNYNFGSAQTRNAFARLAKGLLAKGDTVRAVVALDAAIEKMPFTQIRHNFVQTFPLIEGYYMAGEFSKGNAVLEDYARILGEYVTYLLQFKGDKGLRVRDDLESKIRELYYLHHLAYQFGQEEQMKMIEEIPLMKEYLYEE